MATLANTCLKPSHCGAPAAALTPNEAYLKTEWSDSRLSATLAFYHLTKQNILTLDPVNPSFSIQTGEARSRSIEFDLSGEITPRWSITAAYAFTDTESIHDNSGREGFRIEDVPEHNGSLWTATGSCKAPCRA